ncbi:MULTISPECIES: hypothetical protein [unclassified Ensifer]|uniref:hypothetical protein n=1 Tax=unclassified Ensifer TaxID=2633371 RepID=UPI00137481F2|nr:MULTISPECIES: hypothetical protein [unclassified Ensifer]
MAELIVLEAVSKFYWVKVAPTLSAELLMFWMAAGRPGVCVCSGDEFGVAGWNGRNRL